MTMDNYDDDPRLPSSVRWLEWDYASSHYVINNIALCNESKFMLKLVGAWVPVTISFEPEGFVPTDSLKRAWWIKGTHNSHKFRFNASEIADALFPVRFCEVHHD